jgi:hypothetical protein
MYRRQRLIAQLTTACQKLADRRTVSGQENYGAILDAFASVGASTNKNVRSAWASFLVNLSLLLTTESKADSDGALIAMSAVAELLDNSPKDAETMFRHAPLHSRSSAQIFSRQSERFDTPSGLQNDL